jgi:hypothetical protein
MQASFGVPRAPSAAAPAARPFRPHQLGFWRAFFTTTRPYLACVSGSSGALAALFLAYGLGQAAAVVGLHGGALAVSGAVGALSLVPSALLVGPAFLGRLTGSIVSAPFWLAGVVLLVVAHAGMLGVRRDEDAHPWITHSVRSFVLLRLGEALVADPSLFHGAVAIVIAMEATLATRPERTQV